MRKQAIRFSVITCCLLVACSTPTQNPDGTGSTPKTATVTVTSYDQFFYETDVGSWYATEKDQIVSDYNKNITSLQNLLSLGVITESDYETRAAAANQKKTDDIAALDAKKYAEDHYADADINYTITNTDSSDITTIHTYFKVTTTDGSTFTDSHLVVNIPAGTTRAATASINTSKKKAAKVEIVSSSAL